MNNRANRQELRRLNDYGVMHKCRNGRHWLEAFVGVARLYNDVREKLVDRGLKVHFLAEEEKRSIEEESDFSLRRAVLEIVCGGAGDSQVFIVV